jgi:simple sugar transport system ATP-binding protein
MRSEGVQTPDARTGLATIDPGEHDYLVQMLGICKSFGGLQALKDVDLNVRRREVMGLVGDNAAGKSTLMKILTGAYTADSGYTVFDGKRVTIQHPHDSRNLGIEMIYQELGLCAKRNATANLFLGRERIKMSLGILNVLDWPGMRRDAAGILDNLHIRLQSLDLPIEKLSGGQRQAVAIGRAVSFDPKLVIMDEPTASLALKEVDAVLELIASLKHRGISVILISHRLQDVFRVADRITILRSGEVAATHVTSDVTMDDVVSLMFLGRERNGRQPSQP